MQGYQVNRKGGWDCHGLPVELAVEKELGFSGKADIEAFGIAEFNARCRESVQRYVDLWEQMTDRMGCWIDMREPYRTMDPEYVESVWWALKQIHQRGLLVEDYRVAPYCPRCGTGLSDHELAQGYETVTDPSVYVRFPLTSGPYAGSAESPGAALLVWTTTPWTLVSNALVAAHPEMTYVTATKDGETLVVAESWWRRPRRGLDGRRPVQRHRHGRLDLPAPLRAGRVAGPDRRRHHPPDAHFVVTEDYVTAEDGTGLVHQSPAFGEDDFALVPAQRCRDGQPDRPARATSTTTSPLVGGQFFRHANTDLVADLEARGLLFRHVPYEHSYPHCWRCHTALLYYAQPSWYVRTTAGQGATCSSENEKTNWFPSTIKHGRYGDWLENNIDWALSRSRYWGTPLPIWRCDEDHQTVRRLAGGALRADRHRPVRARPAPPLRRRRRPRLPDAAASRPRRVPEVIDAWFDSGSMPFAQWGYPHVEGSAEMLERAYPADFICEAIDQTRGWFYTLMASGRSSSSSRRTATCCASGHILAEDGRKMSKHLGNILEPIPLMDEHGADAVRWFMAAGGSPWAARRVGHATIQETVRKVLLTYWNTVAFHVLYANLAGWTPRGHGRDPGVLAALGSDGHVLDRWALSEAHRLVGEVTVAMESFDTQRAGQPALGVRRRPVQLVRTPLAPPLLGRRPRGLRDAARVPADRHPADGAAGPVHHRAGVARRRSPPTALDLPESVHLSDWPRQNTELVDADLSATGEAGPSPRRAGPRGAGRARRCAPASRCAGRWSRRLPTTASPTSCSGRWPRS